MTAVTTVATVTMVTTMMDSRGGSGQGPEAEKIGSKQLAAKQNRREERTRTSRIDSPPRTGSSLIVFC